MKHLLFIIIIFSTSLTAMSALYLAMDKQQKVRQHLRRLKFRPLYFRIAGYVLLTVSLLLSMQLWGRSIGIAAWFGILTLVVGGLIILLSYQARFLERLMLDSLGLCIACSLAYVIF